MAFNIKDDETDRLTRQLAAVTGESITEAVKQSVRERLLREAGRSRSGSLTEELLEIGRRCASLPVLDARSPDELLGYDEDGLPN
jgi:antitoxin VapB